MKAAIAGIVGAILIAVVSYFVLTHFQEPSSERYAVKDSVRL
jgi:hypothetical protein